MSPTSASIATNAAVFVAEIMPYNVRTSAKYAGAVMIFGIMVTTGILCGARWLVVRARNLERANLAAARAGVF